MRVLVDIPENYLKEFADLCAQEKVSRAELIRQAIAQYFATKNKKVTKFSADAFGIWKDREDVEDGLTYQERLRSEW